MRAHLLVGVVAFCTTPTLAFYPYIQEGAHGAELKGSVGGRSIDIAPDGTLKMGLFKKRRPSNHVGPDSHRSLFKRSNNFQINKSGNPSTAQSAALDEDPGDYSYMSQVTLGSNPGETVYLLMDTGSSALWVFGPQCTATACTSHNTFGSANSASTAQTSDTFSIDYATGTCAGPIVTDDVQVAGLNMTMNFGIATQASNDFNDYPMDGILGLSRSPGVGYDAPTFMQVVQKNKLLKSNVFGMHLQRASDNSNDGEINFGGFDTSKFTGSLNYLPTVSTTHWWEVAVDGFAVNGQSTTMTGKSAVIDSGSSLMFLPPADAALVHAQIPGAQNATSTSYTIPCDTAATVGITFNKVTYDISPHDYVGPAHNGQCMSNIISQTTVDANTWLLGATFLKNVYAVFDMDQNRVGLGTPPRSSLFPSSSSAGSSPSASPSATASGSAAPSTVGGSAAASHTALGPQPTGSSASPTAAASGSGPSGAGSTATATGTAASASSTSGATSSMAPAMSWMMWTVVAWVLCAS